MAIASVTVGSNPSGTFATMMPIEKTRLMRVGRSNECADDEHEQADGDREDGDEATERDDLLLKRRRHVGRGLGETGNAAKDGMHARRKDQRLRFASGQ